MLFQVEVSKQGQECDHVEEEQTGQEPWVG